MVEPAVVVLGVGAITLGVDPVGVVYQYRVSVAEAVVAVNGRAADNWQYTSGLTTVAAVGVGCTLTLSEALGPSQLAPVLMLT